MIKTLVIDPGVTTGVSVFTTNNFYNKINLINKEENVFSKVFSKELKTFEELEGIICGGPIGYTFDFVIFERYQLYASSKFKMGSTFPEVEFIGVLKYLCEKNNYNPIALMPNVKKFWTDERLKFLGFEEKSEHIKDTIKLYLYFHDNFRKIIKNESL